MQILHGFRRMYRATALLEKALLSEPTFQDGAHVLNRLVFRDALSFRQTFLQNANPFRTPTDPEQSLGLNVK